MEGSENARHAMIDVVDGPRDLATVRKRVRGLLAGAPEREVVDALLVANELTTLAWLQEAEPFTVRLRLTGAALRAEVEADLLPGTDLGGAGELLDRIATGWGIRRAKGTTLWAEVAADTGARAAHSVAVPIPRTTAAP
ncbi:hypothetical protein [Prauserella flavalba]|uniref:ATP-binding protein n=1 Tax=Prauserella flavalba TaxID=1477506 RepID=A0A318LL74_9PSEU|nr:hypothetical protein [Prauserella flavalba]PXY35396.1 hypothetical protein BA062_07590 [Prauserella flavalba]